MNSQSHSVISSPVRSTIEITTHQLVGPQVTVRPSVMVIDADEAFLQLIKQALSHNYQVLTAHDSSEAARLLRRGRFELLMVDLSMPMCDGIGLLQKIRSNARLREVPVLVLATSHELRRRLADLDVVGIMPKARWLDDLGSTVGETIRLAAATVVSKSPTRVPTKAQPEPAAQLSSMM